MTKLWTRPSNTSSWMLYGEVLTTEVTYHCRKIRQMAPGAYIKIGNHEPIR